MLATAWRQAATWHRARRGFALRMALFATFVWNQISGRFCFRFNLFLIEESLTIWRLDPNEAKVSNFRDVVSLALPFEGETGEVAKIRAFLSFLGKDILKPFLRSSITLQMFWFNHVFITNVLHCMWVEIIIKEVSLPQCGNLRMSIKPQSQYAWNKEPCKRWYYTCLCKMTIISCVSFLHNIDKWLEVDLPAWEQCAQVTCLPLSLSLNNHTISPLCSHRGYFSFGIFRDIYNFLCSSLACFALRLSLTKISVWSNFF